MNTNFQIGNMRITLLGLVRLLASFVLVVSIIVYYIFLQAYIVLVLSLVVLVCSWDAGFIYGVHSGVTEVSKIYEGELAIMRAWKDDENVSE